MTKNNHSKNNLRTLFIYKICSEGTNINIKCKCGNNFDNFLIRSLALPQLDCRENTTDCLLCAGQCMIHCVSNNHPTSSLLPVPRRPKVRAGGCWAAVSGARPGVSEELCGPTWPAVSCSSPVPASTTSRPDQQLISDHWSDLSPLNYVTRLIREEGWMDYYRNHWFLFWWIEF